jgi:catechol 2,3-dioxygenase-like lactoylglutathione lyase family enzyme
VESVWKLGPSYIVLVQTRRKYLNSQYHRSATGLNHLAFHAGSRNEVDLITEELRAREIKVLYEDKHPFAGGRSHYALFFEDPDRIKVELVAPRRRG